MDVGDAVRIIQASSEFYSTVSMRCDPLMLGRQGRVVSYAMSDSYEPGWKVNLTNGGEHFFYEEELEVIEEIDGPRQEATPNDAPRPAWCDEYKTLGDKLFEVEMGAEFERVFLGWFKDEEAVCEHMDNLLRGEE